MRFLKFPTAALVSVAIVFSPTAAAAEACQAGPGGCVLPIAEAPPPPPPVTAGPVETLPVAGRGFNILPFLLAGAALIALLLILLSNDDDEDQPASP